MDTRETRGKIDFMSPSLTNLKVTKQGHRSTIYEPLATVKLIMVRIQRFRYSSVWSPVINCLVHKQNHTPQKSYWSKAIDPLNSIPKLLKICKLHRNRQDYRFKTYRPMEWMPLSKKIFAEPCKILIHTLLWGSISVRQDSDRRQELDLSSIRGSHGIDLIFMTHAGLRERIGYFSPGELNG